MENRDIRWEQRFSNFRKALSKLGEAVSHENTNKLTELEKEGLIQRFEYTYELAWKTLQDLLIKNGYLEIVGPNPVIEQAFQDGLIKNSLVWKKMKKSRELTSHTYNSETAEEIVENIIQSYYNILKELETRLEKESFSNKPNLSDE